MSWVQRQSSLSSASTDHIDQLRMACARQTSHHFNAASSVNGKKKRWKTGCYSDKTSPGHGRPIRWLSDTAHEQYTAQYTTHLSKPLPSMPPSLRCNDTIRPSVRCYECDILNICSSRGKKKIVVHLKLDQFVLAMHDNIFSIGEVQIIISHLKASSQSIRH